MTGETRAGRTGTWCIAVTNPHPGGTSERCDRNLKATGFRVLISSTGKYFLTCIGKITVLVPVNPNACTKIAVSGVVNCKTYRHGLNLSYTLRGIICIATGRIASPQITNVGRPTCCRNSVNIIISIATGRNAITKVLRILTNQHRCRSCRTATGTGYGNAVLCGAGLRCYRPCSGGRGSPQIAPGSPAIGRRLKLIRISGKRPGRGSKRKWHIRAG